MSEVGVGAFDFLKQNDPSEALAGAANDHMPDLAQTADSALAQASELAGLDPAGGAADGQAAELNQAEEEEKRVAAAQADWESVLGQKLGGKAFEAIREHTTYDALLGHAESIVGKLSEAIGGLVKPGDEITADQAVKLNAVLAAELAPWVEAQAAKWLESDSGKKVLTSIGNFVEGHPRTVVAFAAGAAIGAAVYAYMSNMDPDKFSETFKIGENLEVGAGIDIGPLQSLSLQAVDLSIKYNTDNFSAQAGAAWSEEKGVTASAELAANGEIGGVATEAKLAGAYNEADGVTANASLTGEGQIGGFDAKGGLSAAYGPDGTSAAANMSLSGNVGQVKTQTDGSVEMGEDGELKLSLGTAFSGQTEGETPYKGSLGVAGKPEELDVTGQFTLGEGGEQSTIKGTYDTATGAFSFGLDRTSMDGRLTQSSTYGQDGDGNATHGNSLSWEDEHLKANAGQQVNSDGVTNTFGLETDLGTDNFTLGGQHSSGPGGTSNTFNLDYEGSRLQAGLDLEMSDAVSTLGLRSSAQIGDELSVGLNTTYDLNASRITELGAKVGWQDPDAFKSFTLEYQAKWLSENPGYEHGFDAAFEYSVGQFAGRLNAGVDLNGSQLTNANIDAVGRYQINDKWSALGSATYERDFTQGQDNYRFGVGAQYKKDVGVLLEYEPETKAVGLRFVVPF